MERRQGFTLIELLIVMVIIGILASIAIPSWLSVKRRGYEAGLRSDLRNLVVAQENYLHDHGTYSPNGTLLQSLFVPTAGNTLNIVQATPAGWSATITSVNTPTVCALYVGTAPLAPATIEGVVGCQ
jgi:prepilin-type N-terminal cleavage/methylation domain-containing protein